MFRNPSLAKKRGKTRPDNLMLAMKFCVESELQIKNQQALESGGKNNEKTKLVNRMLSYFYGFSLFVLSLSLN